MKRLTLSVMFASLALSAMPLLAGDLDPSHPSNPYDEAGRVHNLVLSQAAEVLATMDPQPVPMTLDVLHLVRESLCDAEAQTPCRITLPGIAVARLLEDPDGEKDRMASTMGRTERAYFQAISETLEATEAGPGEKIEKLRRLEVRILEALPGEAGEELLKAASVGRYSTAYWASEAAKDRSVWNVAPDLLSDEQFDEVAAKIPHFDAVGGWCGSIMGYDPGYGALMSAMAIVWSIISMFL